MKFKQTWLRLILIVGLLFIPSTTVYAQTPDSDIIRFGDNFTLENGETLNHAIAVFGGNVTIEEKAVVNGDTLIVGGNLDITGNINGDIVIIGGNVTISGNTDGEIVLIGGNAKLRETAVVDGNISTIGGNVDKEEGAKITGNITNNAPPSIDIPNTPSSPEVPDAPNYSRYDFSFNPFWEIAGAFGTAVLIALIGMLLMLFLQPQIEHTGHAIVSQPFLAGAFGLLAVILIPIAIIAMLVTILLIPVAIILAFLIPLAWLFGMIVLGHEIGNRFSKAINQTWAPVISTGFGTFLLVLIAGLIELVPCIGWLVSSIIYLIAIGGTALTIFGTRNSPTKAIVQVDSPPSA